MAEIRSEQRQVLGNQPPQALGNPQRQPHPVLEAPAVLIGAMIAQGRKELVQKVAVGRMDFNQAKAGRQRPLRGVLEGRHDALDTGFIQRDGHGIALVEGNGTGTDDGPSARFGRLRLAPPFHGGSQLALRPACAN